MRDHLVNDVKLKKSERMFHIKRVYLRHFYFSTKKRIEFYRMLNTLTANGVSIQMALTQIKKKFEQIKQKDNPINAIISDILNLMKAGMPFHFAIRRWLPNQEYVLIKASHQDIPRALKIVTQHAEHNLSIKSALVSSLTYPIMMFCLSIGAIAMLSFYIIPNMAKLVSVDKWPPMSYNLYLLGNAVTENATLIAVVFICIITFITWSLGNLPAYGVRTLLDKLPPWNIYKAYTATSFLIALSSSIKLGSSFNSAILQMQPISSPYLKRYLKKVKNRLMSGSNFGDAIDIGLFDSITLVSLSVFAVTNRLEQGIQYIADNNLVEQRQMIVRRGKVLGYCMMVFVTGIIGWIVLAMYGMQSAVSA